MGGKEVGGIVIAGLSLITGLFNQRRLGDYDSNLAQITQCAVLK